MASSVSRVGSVASALAEPTAARPVMLVTFDVPFDAAAVELAVDTAIESGQKLIVVNVSAMPILPISMRLGFAYVESEELTAALRAPAELAQSLAVRVELLRVSTPRPVKALLELVAERGPGLLVIGPDRARIQERLYVRVAKRVRERANCLVWLAPED